MSLCARKQKIFGYNLVISTSVELDLKLELPVAATNIAGNNENLTADALRNRGYDQNGWPFAPCGIPAKPNGFDRKHKRHTFCCRKQCLDLKAAGIREGSFGWDFSIDACLSAISSTPIFISQDVKELIHVLMPVNISEQYKKKKRNRIIRRRTFNAVTVCDKRPDKGKTN